MNPNSNTARACLGLAGLLLAGAVAAQATPTPARAPSPTPTPRPATPASAPAPVAVAETPEAWFQAMDVDGNRQLTLPEFKTGLEKRNQAVMFQRLQTQFMAIDKNRSGAIEAVEFQAMPGIRKAGANAPTLASVDTSKDGKLDLREFVGLITKLIER